MNEKLWAGTAVTEDGIEYGTIAVVAETKFEAVSKARIWLQQSRNELEAVSDGKSLQSHIDALLANLHAMIEVPEGVVMKGGKIT